MPPWLTLLALLSGLLMGAPHRPRVYANPNLTILGIAEDSGGALWLAADDGLHRFDGLRFHRISGGPFAKLRYVGVTRDDAVWVAGSHGLARYDGAFRTISTEPVVSFSVAPDHVLAMSPGGYLWRVGLDGSRTQLPFKSQTRPFSIDGSGTLWRVAASGKAACYHRPEELWKPRRPGSDWCAPLPEDLHFAYALPDAQGRVWAANETKAIRYERERRAAVLDRRPGQGLWRPSPLALGRSGQLWFVGETVYGVSPEITLRLREEDQSFLATSAYQSRDGRLWIAARGKGLIEWTVDSSWQRWPAEEFNHQPLISVFWAGSSMLAASADALYRLNPDGRWSRAPSDSPSYLYALTEPDGSLLASLRSGDIVKRAASGAPIKRFQNPRRRGGVFSKMARDPNGVTWIVSKEELFSLSGTLTDERLTAAQLPDSPPSGTGVSDLKVDARGRVWAAYAGGLAWRNESGGWTKLMTDRPLERIRCFAFDGKGDGDEIWVGFRVSGVIARLRRDGSVWRVTDYAVGSGGTADTRFLERDSRGWIWRGTLAGAYVSSGGKEPKHWLHLNRQSGLAADRLADAGFFEDRQGSIWLAGEEGISRIQPDPAWFAAAAHAPRISRIVVDETEFLRPDTMTQIHARKSLRFDIGGRPPLFRDHPFLYRLVSDHAPDAEFQLTNGALVFEDLAQGEYTLFAKYSADGSPALTFQFRMGAPPLWPWLAIPLAGGALGWLFRESISSSTAAYWISKYWFLAWRPFRKRPAPSVSAVGQILHGRYSLEEVISRSEFSDVYAARDTREDRRVAVKVFRSKPERKAARERFFAEVVALQSLQHPAIVPVSDWWITGKGEPCIAMPFLEGSTLRATLAAGPLLPFRAARILRQLGEALREAHARGIVHRDLSPNNVLITGTDMMSEQAVLLDFGAAGFLSAENALEHTQSLIGAFHYLAPERLSGHYAAVSDLYALAVIAFEMLSGKRLYDLRAPYASDSFAEELIASLRPQLGDKSESAAALLRPCFDPNPHGRPADTARWAHLFAAAIDQRILPN